MKPQAQISKESRVKPHGQDSPKKAVLGPVPPRTFIHVPASLDTDSTANGGEHLVGQSRALFTGPSSQQTRMDGRKGSSQDAQQRSASLQTQNR